MAKVKLNSDYLGRKAGDVIETDDPEWFERRGCKRVIETVLKKPAPTPAATRETTTSKDAETRSTRSKIVKKTTKKKVLKKK
jgi:hypothetical protein